MGELSFEKFGLSEEILKSIAKLGYKRPSDVQQKVLPLALEDKDIIVKSQTGSGKTAAFAIPLCEKLELERTKPQVLVLTPTRELCVQVKDDITNIGRYKRIRCTALIGKEPFYHQVRELKQRTHVVVGTPGRTLDHIEKGSINLEDIKYLIIDEADEMLNMGFIEDVEAIISKLPKDRTTMLFSATIPIEVEELCHKYLIKPTKVEINPEQLTTEKVQHLYYQVAEGEKFNLLEKVITIENPDTCIIFCRTQDNVESLYNRLADKVSCMRLHGGMLQGERFDVMNSFRRGEVIYLVATDVAARGIDVENVTHIINYDIPMEKERYVHRIGRSGRAGKEGKAISFVTPYEGRFFAEIQEYIGFNITKAEEPQPEAVERASQDFQKKISTAPKLKADKGAEINKDIDKLYINGGKKKKIRPGDIVGAITNIEGVTAEDIGVIDILDNFSYIDILNGKGNIVLEALKTMNIKGKTVRVQKATK
jgi:ATP-dependent RNA helicase DeaD